MSFPIRKLLVNKVNEVIVSNHVWKTDYTDKLLANGSPLCPNVAMTLSGVRVYNTMIYG